MADFARQEKKVLRDNYAAEYAKVQKDIELLNDPELDENSAEQFAVKAAYKEFKQFW